MEEQESANINTDTITIESIFVRHRNVLLLRGTFSIVFEDYFLNLVQHNIKNPPEVDRMMRELIAGITLHVVAKPWAETHAWTVTLRAPRVNLFATADSHSEQVTGRAFLEHVKEPDRNMLYATIAEPQKETRKSTVELPSNHPSDWVTHFYKQSEQRLTKFFELDGDDFALLTAQPDADEEWLESLDAEAVKKLAETEELSPLEKRKFQFKCGCNVQKILPALSSWSARPDELFGESSSININCPRCGASYPITRDML